MGKIYRACCLCYRKSQCLSTEGGTQKEGRKERRKEGRKGRASRTCERPGRASETPEVRGGNLQGP